MDPKYKQGDWVRIKTFEEYNGVIPDHFFNEMKSFLGKFVQIKDLMTKFNMFSAILPDNPSLGLFAFTIDDIAESWVDWKVVNKQLFKMKKEIYGTKI